MWHAFGPYCADENFISDAQVHFVSRTWELYLGATFLRRRLRLVKAPKKGPDILIQRAQGRIWVEATAVSAGDTEDAVPSRDRRGTKKGTMWLGKPPSEQSLMLRCIGGITTKFAKVRDYRQAGIVLDSEPVVVAVNLGAIQDADVSEPGMPLIVRALFGIGEPYVVVPIDSDEDPSRGYFGQPTIQKRGGAKVETTMFCTGQSSLIAGVMCSTVGIWNAPRRLGSDIVFVHNPFATARVPCGTFAFADEYFLDASGRIKRHERRRQRSSA